MCIVHVLVQCACNFKCQMKNRADFPKKTNKPNWYRSITKWLLSFDLWKWVRCDFLEPIVLVKVEKFSIEKETTDILTADPVFRDCISDANPIHREFVFFLHQLNANDASKWTTLSAVRSTMLVLDSKPLLKLTYSWSGVQKVVDTSYEMMRLLQQNRWLQNPGLRSYRMRHVCVCDCVRKGVVWAVHSSWLIWEKENWFNQFRHCLLQWGVTQKLA